MADIDGDKKHFKIRYDEKDIEEHASRAVITLLKSRVLDRSPEMMSHSSVHDVIA